MSARGGTKRDLLRVIAERDAELVRLRELLRECGKNPDSAPLVLVVDPRATPEKDAR